MFISRRGQIRLWLRACSCKLQWNGFYGRRMQTTRTKILVGASVIVIAVIIIVVVVVTTKKKPVTNYDDRLECVAGPNDQKKCESAGCRWDGSSPPEVPKCVLPQDSQFGFRAENSPASSGDTFLNVSKGSFFGNDFRRVRLTVSNINENILRIKFTDATTDRYEVPVTFNTVYPTPNINNLAYKVELQLDPKSLFYFKVFRNDTGAIIFDSSAGSLFLADRHLEVTTRLPSTYIYGIGENAHRTFRHNLHFKKWPLFSRDQFPDPWDGDGQHNLYGVHPYYTCLESDGRSHGVLFLNSNAMEFTLTPMPALNFRSTGGVLDMFFFLGDNPEHLVQLYTRVVGRPMIPPYWSLGFQLSHYGYNSLTNMKGAIQRTRAAKIPLDVVHSDIDHMESNKDFTYDKERFAGLPEFVTEEKNKGLRFIIILDPALLANDTNYSAYQSGVNKNVFVKWPDYIKKEDRNNPVGVIDNKDIMFGRVWPAGPVAFPDFFKDVTRTWWEENIKEYRKVLDFDALWIDMNEPAVFGTDQEFPWYCPPNEKCWGLKCPNNKYDNMSDTFLPAAVSVNGPQSTMSDKTLCMAAVFGEKGELVHYNVHSIYGWSQIRSTYKALENSAKPDQAPLVISRSTYPSSGKHGGHWLGDNKSRWEDMRASIIGMLEFNLFGIPYIGADVCGFFMNATGEMCGRWMQLGAFSPFSRNHNSMGFRDQDPGNPELMSSKDIKRSKDAMDTRYQLLPYLHTLHYMANWRGNTVVRPLFHEFPNDTQTYDIQEQFMWGSALLISPVLYQGQENVKLYLPNDIWYDFYKGNKLEQQYLTVTDTEQIPLHVRAGHILPLKERGAQNTKASRLLNFELRVYPKNGQASGDLFWMSETATNTARNVAYKVFTFELKTLLLKSVLTIKIKEDAPFQESLLVGKIVIYDQEKEPSEVTNEGTRLKQDDFKYDIEGKILTISLKINLSEIHTNIEPSSRLVGWIQKSS